MAEGSVSVSHVDHTVEPGGAEIALRRLLQGPHEWDGMVFVPPSAAGVGEYAALPRELVEVVGVRQRAGAITGSAIAKVGMIGGVVAQGVALRFSPRFRRRRLVHANTSRAALIALVATIGSRRRLVVHLRDAMTAEAIGGAALKAMGVVLRRADGVIANSQYTLGTARRWIRPAALSVVIPSSIGHGGDRAIASLRAEVQTVGMLARLAPWKGQAETLRAFAGAFPDSSIRLQFAGSAAFGEDAYEQHLRTLADRLGVADRVDFLGQVDDIWPLLDSWDVCIHASTKPEPLGQNLLQYLAAARPTIAARAGGPLEWVEDGRTGLLVGMGDVDELAKALRRMADEPSLRERLHAALAEANPVLRDDQIAARYGDFFARFAS